MKKQPVIIIDLKSDAPTFQFTRLAAEFAKRRFVWLGSDADEDTSKEISDGHK